MNAAQRLLRRLYVRSVLSWAWVLSTAAVVPPVMEVLS